MCRPAALTFFALMTALASGFATSPQPAVGSNPQGSMTLTSTVLAGVRRRPASARAPFVPPPSAVAEPPSALFVRGGSKTRSKTASAASMALSGGDDSAGTAAAGPLSVLSSLWGAGGVCYILLKAIKRVVPIALEPFSKTEGVVPLTSVQLAIYAATCAWFAYVEGYKGFQLKFSPLVASRSRTLVPGTSSFVHILLAPLYSMGLFHATRKRMIVSWSVTLGVAGIVAAVKRLPYPWRNIVDAGVVVGLTWGTLSIMLSYVKAMVTGKNPCDPALPEKKAD